MKQLSLLVIFISMLVHSHTHAQAGKNFQFTFRCVPTSTDDYSIAITDEGLKLKKTEKKANDKKVIKYVDVSEYSYSFNAKEKEKMAGIIRDYSLDSAGLYQERKTQWGIHWDVKFERNEITYTISLPNYSNTGLEALLHFAVCLIPKKEEPTYVCRTCE